MSLPSLFPSSFPSSSSSLSHAAASEPHVLYHNTLPMTLSSPTKDSHLQQTTVSISASSLSSSSSSSLPSLHLQLTCRDDPYFLYLCDLTEQDFAGMKREQHITVDFLAFPLEIRRLLDLTALHQPDSAAAPPSSSSAAPHYICTLCTADGLLRVIHLSHFRHVDFLTLRLRAASDAQLKKMLADDLIATRRDRDEAREKVERVERERAEAEDRERAVARQLAEGREREQAAVASIYRQHAEEMQQLTAQHTAAVADAARRSEEAAERAQRDSRERIRTLESQLAEATERLDRTAACLLGLQKEHDAQRAGLDAVSKDFSSVKEERDRVRKERDSLQLDLTEERRRREEAQRRLLQLEQQVADGALLQEKTDRLVQSEREQRAVTEESLRVLRERGEALEQRVEGCVAELHRGNSVISRLQQKLSQMKEKGERRKRVLVAQEERVRAVEEEKRELERTGMELRMRLEREEAEKARLRERAQQLEKTVEEYSAQLKENVNTIAYLNNRETDKLIHRGYAAPPPPAAGGAAALSDRLSALFPASTAALTGSSHVYGHGGAPFTPAAPSSVSFASPSSTASAQSSGSVASSLSSRFYSLSDLSGTPLSSSSQPGHAPAPASSSSASSSAPSSSSSPAAPLSYAAASTPLPIEKRLSAITRSQLGLSAHSGGGVRDALERGRIGGVVSGSVRVLSSLSSFAAAPAASASSSSGKEKAAAAADDRKVNDENVENRASTSDAEGRKPLRSLSMPASSPTAVVAPS